MMCILISTKCNSGGILEIFEQVIAVNTEFMNIISIML